MQHDFYISHKVLMYTPTDLEQNLNDIIYSSWLTAAVINILDLQWSIMIVTLFSFTASQTGQIWAINEKYQYMYK